MGVATGAAGVAAGGGGGAAAKMGETRAAGGVTGTTITRAGDAAAG